MAYDFASIERKWQDYWLTHKTFAALEPAQAAKAPKAYVLDMFPYPSGAGLHVGHPEGYTATDILSRYLRMTGHNVLHPMGWDAFGLPAEQYAIKTNTHPRLTTEQNIANFRRQIQMLGLGYDWDREINTTDPAYYRWTQWIFLQLFNSYFDPVDRKAKPIAHLVNELQNENFLVAPDGQLKLNRVQEGMEPIAGEVRIERSWKELTPQEQRDAIDGQRLAYMDEIPVNWCPALGTVLANEEVIDGKSEVGGFPVERRPMRQWMLRITAYADRLADDLDLLQWPQSLKEMQRNWIGRSEGAQVDFEIASDPGPADPEAITVFTTRPDTLYGATYMVLAPEHPLVDQIVTAAQRPAVEAYRAAAAAKSERDRMTAARDKSGVFTGAYAINPVTEQKIPIWIADYVLLGYGTGAIMAVPAHDDRDFEFARKFGLPIKAVVLPDDAWFRRVAPSMDVADAARRYRQNPADFSEAFVDEGLAIQSPLIEDLPTSLAKQRITEHLESAGLGVRSVQYKLRDWLFSRQRYWGEPFPILLDDEGNAYAVDESELPVVLPDLADFKPTGTPQPPLSKAVEWLRIARDGRVYTRETNTMPQWAGSCWYYLRYIDPHNDHRFVDPAKEQYWMPVDLYVGGVEHAVLHLLYSRFWHKVLYDLGHVSTPEPFQRLVNQGLILGELEYHLFTAPDGRHVSAVELDDIKEEALPEGPRLVGMHRTTGQRVVGGRIDAELVEKRGERVVLKSDPAIVVDARAFKMSKSRGNVINPDQIIAEYGADCFRLYEMYMGPLEAPKPWNTRDIVGMSRFLNSVWRNIVGEPDTEGTQPAAATRVADVPIADALERMMHRTIQKVGQDIHAMRFNTAIAELIKLNNEITGLKPVPRQLAQTFTLLLAPLAPHLAEELWQRLGHQGSLASHPWPRFDADKLQETSIELPIQVNGKLRDRITVGVNDPEADILAAAEASAKVKPWIEGKTIIKRILVPGKLISFVVK